MFDILLPGVSARQEAQEVGIIGVLIPQGKEVVYVYVFV